MNLGVTTQPATAGVYYPHFLMGRQGRQSPRLGPQQELGEHPASDSRLDPAASLSSCG